jgi:sulfide:quinone oxidoreductase
MEGRGPRAILVRRMTAKRHVLIAGGGVAALEAMLALRQLAPELVDVELVAPEPRFWYRPLAVAEPFGLGDVRSFDLAAIAARADAIFTPGAITGVDADAHVALTEPGGNFEYDSLLLACGALPRAAIPGALTFRGPADTQLIADLVAKVEAGEVHRVVVAVPLGAVWSLPAYELALMLATHAEARRTHDVRIALVTPEDDPLLLFGEHASQTLRTLLDEHEIALHTGYHATIVRDGALHLLPARTIDADAVIALPSLLGIRLDGVPQTRDGFVLVDEHGRVRGLEDVYAAGDITRFPVKQGGIASQQALAAAEAIAAAAGATIEPTPFRPILRGLLLTGGEARYLRRDVASGGLGTATVEPLWWPPTKVVGRYLSPFLAELAGDREGEPPRGDDVVSVEREITADDLAKLERAIEDDAEDATSVGDVMTAELLVVAPEDTLGEVAELMGAQDVGSALVADYGRLIGILTSRDLLRAFAGRIHSSEARVREWMTAEPIAVPRDASLGTAIRLMHEHSIHHLPVVEDRRPVGMVGMRAVARALAERESRAHVGLGF